MSLDKKWEGHEGHIQLNPLCPDQAGVLLGNHKSRKEIHMISRLPWYSISFPKKKKQKKPHKNKHGAFIHFFSKDIPRLPVTYPYCLKWLLLEMTFCIQVGWKSALETFCFECIIIWSRALTLKGSAQLPRGVPVVCRLYLCRTPSS